MSLRIASFVVLLLMLSSPAFPQPQGEWYALGAIGHGAAVIGGGEAVVKDVVGAGAEGGLFLGSHILGSFALSSGISLRVPTRSATRPFLSAGGSYHQWFTGSFHGYYVGGGLDQRLSPTRGLRVEVRRHAGRGHYSSDRIVTLRVGMTFR